MKTDWSGFLVAAIFGLVLLICAVAASPEPQLLNYRVPFPGCLKEVILQGCDESHPPKCESVKVRFTNESCLELVANQK